MQEKIIAVFCFIFLVLAVIFGMQIQEKKAIIPILEGRLEQAQADSRDFESWVRELQEANEGLARQVWDTELSYRNVRQFVRNAREVLDFGNQDYALKSFRDLWDYQPTEEDFSQLISDQLVNVSDPVSENNPQDPELQKTMRAHLLEASLGLTYQFGFQYKNWEPLHRILTWCFEDAPEVFNLGYYQPISLGTMVLNHGAHHALFVLANSGRSEDLSLVKRIIREIPLEQPIFLAVGGWECTEIVSDLDCIQNLPKSLQAIARDRALQEWDLAKKHPAFSPELLNGPVTFEGTQSHRELIAKVLGIKI